jgi:hypothetical protein
MGKRGRRASIGIMLSVLIGFLVIYSAGVGFMTLDRLFIPAKSANSLSSWTWRTSKKSYEQRREARAKEAEDETSASIIDENYSFFMTWLTMCWLVSSVCVAICLLYFCLQYDVELNERVRRQRVMIPEDDPAVAALVLDSESNTGAAQFIATVFSLYTKGVIDLREQSGDIEIELLGESSATRPLSEAEGLIYHWFVQQFDGQKCGTYNEFFALRKLTWGNAMAFMQTFYEFEQNVRQMHTQLDIVRFDGANANMPWLVRQFLFLYIGLSSLLAFLFVFDESLKPIYVGVIFLTLLYYVNWSWLKYYKNHAPRLTPAGLKRQGQVEALKQYIIDYPALDDSDKDVHRWEQYFVYGVALHVSDLILYDVYEHMCKLAPHSFDLTKIKTLHRLSYDFNIVLRTKRDLMTIKRMSRKSRWYS